MRNDASATGRKFPFGRPVVPSPPSASDSRKCYVLGAYPSGLHVEWTPPESLGLKRITALIVDNEPEPFWNGADAVERTTEWLEAVGWNPEWGAVKAVPRHNGPSGHWVDKHILRPLGLTRDDVCISDCLDESRLNPGQSRRITDTYQPAASVLGLPDCTLKPVPGSESAIVKETREGHLERLRSELRTSNAATVVTLGNAALRVFEAVVEFPRDHRLRQLRDDVYGESVPVKCDGRDIVWRPLVHPRNGERHPRWREIHHRWEAAIDGRGPNR